MINIEDEVFVDNGCPGISISLFSQELIEKSDSIGYYHNKLMAYFEENSAAYIKNGEPDIENMYEYMAAFIREKGFDYDNYSKNLVFKDKMMTIYSDLGRMARNAKNLDEYLSQQYLYMSGNCQISDEDIEIFKNFSVEITKKCSELSIEQIHEYAQDLNTLILNSNVSPAMRVDLGFAAQSAINSSLCWR